MLAVTVFLIYLVFIYYIGFKGYQKVKSAEDLLVAGWSMPFYVVTGSLISALLAAPFFSLQRSVQAICPVVLKEQQRWLV